MNQQLTIILWSEKRIHKMTARPKVCSKCGQRVIVPDNLGGRIMMKRIEHNKSRSELASILAKSAAYIMTVETGKTDIRFGDLKKIATYLKTDLNFFIGE
jgi:ribosome-binding protein aMBF1 (putative translation factor)|tara:strand:- start:715 stop:1014 length:300 start_codon:yes stop_codon:yes gene_type:complete